MRNPSQLPNSPANPQTSELFLGPEIDRPTKDLLQKANDASLNTLSVFATKLGLPENYLTKNTVESIHLDPDDFSAAAEYQPLDRAININQQWLNEWIEIIDDDPSSEPKVINNLSAALTHEYIHARRIPHPDTPKSCSEYVVFAQSDNPNYSLEEAFTEATALIAIKTAQHPQHDLNDITKAALELSDGFAAEEPHYDAVSLVLELLVANPNLDLLNRFLTTTYQDTTWLSSAFDKGQRSQYDALLATVHELYSLAQ